MTTHIPNSFQTPNVIVDKLMFLLTEQELKCLMFAIRHIMGWRDVINYERKIALSWFADGTSDSKGNIYAGTGLTKPAIRKALSSLESYKILSRKHEQGKTPVFTLAFMVEDCIDYPSLQTRYAEKKIGNQAQIEKWHKVGLERKQEKAGHTVEQNDPPVLLDSTSQDTMTRTVEQNPTHTVEQNDPPVLLDSTHTNPNNKPNSQTQRDVGDLPPLPIAETDKVGYATVITFGDVAKLYADEIGELSAMISQKLGMWFDDVKPAWIMEAIKAAVMQGVRKWVYVEAILKRYQQEGQSDEDKRKAAEAQAAARDSAAQFTRDKYALMAEYDAELKQAG